MKPSFQLNDSFTVDDDRAVDTDKPAGTQELFDPFHAGSEQVGFRTGIDRHVVTLCLDEVDIVDVDDEQATALLYDQAIRTIRGRLDVPEHISNFACHL